MNRKHLALVGGLLWRLLAACAAPALSEADKASTHTAAASGTAQAILAQTAATAAQAAKPTRCRWPSPDAGHPSRHRTPHPHQPGAGLVGLQRRPGCG